MGFFGIEEGNGGGKQGSCCHWHTITVVSLRGMVKFLRVVSAILAIVTLALFFKAIFFDFQMLPAYLLLPAGFLVATVLAFTAVWVEEFVERDVKRAQACSFCIPLPKRGAQQPMGNNHQETQHFPFTNAGSSGPYGAL